MPQGSILSLTLFSLKINNIVKCLNPGVDCSLYVDDFLICYRSKNMNTIERQLQLKTYNAASTEASASSERDMSETLSQKEKQKAAEADSKLKQNIRDLFAKPQRNNSVGSPDP